MKTILVANRKGGVGKTTTVINLAATMAKAGKRVLVIDLDTQGHVQFGLGYKKKIKRGSHQILSEVSLGRGIYKSSVENLHFIPADINYDVSAVSIKKSALKKILRKEPIRHHYDICLIDTPPTSDILLHTAMVASDYVIVPMQTEYLGYVGMMQFLKLFYQTAANLNTKISFLGIVPTLFNKSIPEHRQIVEKLRHDLGKEKILPTVRKDFALSKAFAEGEPVVLSRPRARGAKDYRALYEAIEKKIR